MQPHVIESKQRPRPDGTVEVIPTVLKPRERVMSGDLALQMRQIMQQVVLIGTGTRGKLAGWSSAGKTGSAEIFIPGKGWVDKHNSSFIGFAPVSDPKIVVVVTLNGTPKQGGRAAAPIFAKVAAAALRILQVPMDMPETSMPEPQLQASAAVPASIEALPKSPAPAAATTESLPEPKASPILAGPKVPDFRGMQLVAVMRKSSQLGLDVEVVGSGTATRQEPPPGGMLAPGEKVRVEFARR
jgi:cell division protein FtsI (penicillin-binding protein 3)